MVHLIDHFTNQSFDWKATFVQLCVTVCIGFPFVAYSWVSYIRNKHKLYFFKRQNVLVSLQLALLTVSLLINQPILGALELVVLPRYETSWLRSLFAIYRIFDFSLLIAVNLVLFLRFFILFYDLSFHHINSIQSWRSQISGFEHTSSGNSNFFIRNRSTIGNAKWLTLRVFVCWCLVCTCIFGVAIGLKGTAFDAVIGLIPYLVLALFVIEWVAIVVIWCKFPKLEDKLYIRDELKYTLLYWISLIVVGMVLLVCLHVVLGDGAYRFEFVVDTIHILMLFGVMYFGVMNVIHANEKHTVPYEAPEETLQSLGRLMQSHARVDSRASIGAATNLTQPPMKRLVTLIGTYKGYVEFMNFVVRELASESLLFASEYHQFKQSLRVPCEQWHVLGLSSQLRLSDNLPQTRLVFKPNEVISKHRFYAILSQFFVKYVETSSPLEINIGCELRSKFKNAMMKLKSSVDRDTSFPIYLPVESRVRSISPGNAENAEAAEHVEPSDTSDTDRSRPLSTTSTSSRMSKETFWTWNSKKSKHGSKPELNVMHAVNSVSVNDKKRGTTRATGEQVIDFSVNLDHSVKEVLELCEECVYTVLKLLCNSFSRFSTTTAFDRMIKEMQTGVANS